jgi:hypothetical protein
MGSEMATSAQRPNIQLIGAGMGGLYVPLTRERQSTQ